MIESGSLFYDGGNKGLIRGMLTKTRIGTRIHLHTKKLNASRNLQGQLGCDLGLCPALQERALTYFLICLEPNSPDRSQQSL